MKDYKIKQQIKISATYLRQREPASLEGIGVG